jgi:DNA-binding LytR/AlgR family response regulator
MIEKIKTPGGGKYQIILKSGNCLPVSRQKIVGLKKILKI